MPSDDQVAVAKPTSGQHQGKPSKTAKPKSKQTSKSAGKGSLKTKPKKSAPKAASKSNPSKEKQSRKSKKAEGDEARVGEKRGVSAVLDEENLECIGQFTRAKRFCDSVLDKICEECIGGVRDDGLVRPVVGPDPYQEGDTAESLGLKPANELRWSKKFVQLIRLLAEERLSVVFQQHAVLCRLMNKKTLGHDMVNAARFMSHNGNSSFPKTCTMDAPSLLETVVETYAETFPSKDGSDELSEEALKHIMRDIGFTGEKVESKEDVDALILASAARDAPKAIEAAEE